MQAVLCCSDVTTLIMLAAAKPIWRQENLFMAVIVLIRNLARGEENCSKLVGMATLQKFDE